MKVAFLGLGTMGLPMARNVRRRGHDVTVWNRTIERAEPLRAEGCAVAATPAEATRGADVAITMLADPPALEQVALGDGGALAALAPGALFVDCSTVNPETIARLVAAAPPGVTVLDVPVSGTRKPAEAGTLLLLAGGDRAAIDRARPVLETMGRVIVVGESGKGSAMKLVLNGLGAHLIVGFAAGVGLCRALGLDLASAFEIIQQSAFSSPLFSGKLPKVLGDDFRADFSIRLLLKDQRLVLDAAQGAGLALPSLESLVGLMERAIEGGLADEDLAALTKLFDPRA